MADHDEAEEDLFADLYVVSIALCVTITDCVLATMARIQVSHQHLQQPHPRPHLLLYLQLRQK